MLNTLQLIEKTQLTPRIFTDNLGDAVEQYLTFRRLELQPKSLKTYTESLNCLIRFFGSDRPVESIESTELIYFFGSLDRKPSGVFMVWQTAGFFFRWYYQSDPQLNPMITIRMKKPKRDPIEGIDPAQVEKILKKITGATAARDKAIAAVLFSSGLRETEFCNLLISDVNRRTGQINVRTATA